MLRAHGTLRAAVGLGWLAFAGLGCQSGTQSESVASSRAPIIYGVDNRREPYLYPDQDWARRVADFSVALFSVDELDTSDPNDVKVVGPTLGARFGLCSDESFLDQPAAASCSGTLIGPDLVLTAGHCLDPNACSQARFVFDYAMSESQLLEPLTTNEVYACAEVLVRKAATVDYAIVRLDRSVKGRAPARVRSIAIPVGAGESLVFAGHPSGLPRKIANGAVVTEPRATPLDFFTSNLDSFPGSSGSGVFLEKTGELVGILVRGPNGRGDGYVQLEGESCARPERVADIGNALVESVYASNALQALCVATANPELCPCGNGVCESERWESSVTCPEDCGASCGDGVCNGGETGANCYADCGACGNLVCEPDEANRLSCCDDCGCPSGFSCNYGACSVATGNVNGDAKIDEEDLALMDRSATHGGRRSFRGDVADVDCSGTLDVHDRDALAGYLDGTLTALPCDSIVDVALGGRHTCILLGNGQVRCWGDNAIGQLGYGNSASVGYLATAPKAGPVPVGFAARQIAAGNAHSCALGEDGRVKCWGKGSSGELGNASVATIGDDEPPSHGGFVALSGPAHAIAAGSSHTCALLEGGAVQCWGSNGMGQLGIGSTASLGDDELPNTHEPLRFGQAVTQIAAGMNHTCVLLASGAVQCWGANTSGQLGLGHRRNVGDDELPATEPVVSLGAPARALAAGGLNTCAISDSNDLFCWGENAVRQLGYGHNLRIGDDESPSAVGAVPVGAAVADVSVGNLRTCARFVSGTIRCWGLNAAGQLGYGNTRPVAAGQTAGLQSDVDIGTKANRLFAGSDHTCAQVHGRGLVCWGVNTRGALGYDNTVNIGDNESPASVGVVPLGVPAATWSFVNPNALEVWLRSDHRRNHGSRIALILRNRGTKPFDGLQASYLFSSAEAIDEAITLEDLRTPLSTPHISGGPTHGWSLVFDFKGVHLSPGAQTSSSWEGGDMVHVHFKNPGANWNAENDYSASEQQCHHQWRLTDRVQLLTPGGELVYGWTRQ